MSQNTKRKLLGSILSAFVGWAGTLVVCVVPVIYYHGFISDLGRGALFLAVIFGGVWLIFLLPIYLLIPFHSLAWRWPASVAIGTTLATMLIWGVVHDAVTTTMHLVDYLIPGAIMGGVTALFSSVTAKSFVRPDGIEPASSNNALEPTASRSQAQ